MKLFYVTTPEKMQEVRRSWHSLELGNGQLLVCIDWKTDREEWEWSQHPDVTALPHPVFESTKPLTPEHLAHVGKRFGLVVGNDVHHLIRAATKEDLWMRIHVL